MDERIKSILAYCKGPRVLNVGCAGEGGVPIEDHAKKYWMHKWLVDQFDEVVGVDIIQEHIADMKKAGYYAVNMNAEDLDVGVLGTFNSVVAGEVIEHLDNPGRFLRGVGLCLKPDGVLVISTPNPFSPMFFFMYLKNFPKSFNPEHTCWFCLQTLETLGSRQGFELDSFQYVDYLVPEIVSSGSYRVYVYLWRLIRDLLPSQFRNTLVVRMRRETR